ncbi:MAG: acyl-CoA acyltransferase [Epsilonproteobacteria bacterium]|nr:MAG: acyl-CoA acyltransferase [Campylobacterota bacterium]
MNITIRNATKNDRESIAKAMLESSRAEKKRGIFDLIFKTSDESELISALERLSVTETKSYCHFSNFVIAEVDGKMAGVLCGYEPRLAPQEIFTKALGEIGVDDNYLERIAAYMVVEPEVEKNTWVLDFMAVKDEYHEFNVLKELIRKNMLKARLKGYRKVQTMVEIGSVEAQIVYEKLGFSMIDEKQSDYYKEEFGRAGIMRLQMEL